MEQQRGEDDGGDEQALDPLQPVVDVTVVLGGP